jgi:hypothetical protein
MEVKTWEDGLLKMQRMTERKIREAMLVNSARLF